MFPESNLPSPNNLSFTIVNYAAYEHPGPAILSFDRAAVFNIFSLERSGLSVLPTPFFYPVPT